MRDYLDAYVLEWTLHHLDLAPYAGPPPDTGLRQARALVERIAGTPVPDTSTLLAVTGRSGHDEKAVYLA